MAGGATPVFDQRLNLPVDEFLLQALQERFPNLDVRPGSAIYQAVALPMAFGFQPTRDRLNILRRNQSLRNFQYMLPRELDALAANFLVERTGARNANGTVRVYFAAPDDYTVPLSASFSTEDGRTFTPTQATTITQAQILLNFEDGLYYMDVPAQADTSGLDGSIQAGQITVVSGVDGAVTATNKSAFFGGRDEESNAELTARIRRSIATRTLTSRFSIEALLREQFGDALISLAVIGFGDPEMTRDVARSFVAYDDLFTTTYCRKINVSIDADGTVFVGPGTPPVTNRFVGALIDTRNTYSEPDAAVINNPYYFFRLPVVRGGEIVRVAVNRGDRVTLQLTDQSSGPDPDDGDYVVTDIVYQTPFLGHLSGGPNPVSQTMLLVLDRPFANPQPTVLVVTPGSPNLVAYTYAISSGVGTDDFHVGGRADLYVHTTNTFEDTLVISELFVSPAGPTFFDVPIRETPVLNPLSQPYYEDGKVFQLPVVAFVRVEQIDPVDASVVIRELSQGTDYIYVSEDPDTRLSATEVGFIRFIGASLAGARIRVTYQTDSDIQAVQDFVDTDSRRDLTKSVLVKAARPVLVDVRLQWSGSATSADVDAIVRSYINTRPQGGEVTVNQIVSILNVFEVNDIVMPVTLTARRFNDDGTVTETVSTDRLTSEALERFLAVDTLSLNV